MAAARNDRGPPPELDQYGVGHFYFVTVAQNAIEPPPLPSNDFEYTTLYNDGGFNTLLRQVEPASEVGKFIWRPRLYVPTQMELTEMVHGVMSEARDCNDGKIADEIRRGIWMSVHDVHHQRTVYNTFDNKRGSFLRFSFKFDSPSSRTTYKQTVMAVFTQSRITNPQKYAEDHGSSTARSKPGTSSDSVDRESVWFSHFPPKPTQKDPSTATAPGSTAPGSTATVEQDGSLTIKITADSIDAGSLAAGTVYTNVSLQPVADGKGTDAPSISFSAVVDLSKLGPVSLVREEQRSATPVHGTPSDGKSFQAYVEEVPDNGSVKTPSDYPGTPASSTGTLTPTMQDSPRPDPMDLDNESHVEPQFLGHGPSTQGDSKASNT